jgi:pimeloyl-ACP methyl ester carboxylesterase
VASTAPTIQELSIPSGPRRLAARLFGPAESTAPGPGLLFVHGLHSDQGGYRARAEAVCAAGAATCLTFDLGGHGRSDGELGELSLADHLADVLAAFDTLAGDPRVDPGRVGVCGASYGAYLAARVLADRDVERLLIRAPALYADGELLTPLKARRGASDPGAAADFLSRLSRYGGEVLIVESEHDEVIAHSTVEAYRTAFRLASYEVIPDVGHELRDEPSREAFLALIVAWFERL